MSGRVSVLAGATLFEVDPTHVETIDRIGFFHVDKAVAFGRLIATDGQRDPIKVVKNRKGANRPWRLVTGMHRLHGCELEGLNVWAIEVTGKPEDLVDLEASENLHRGKLAPIERAKFTAALVQATQDRIAREHGNLKQHQIAARARWERVKGGEDLAEQALQDEAQDACAKIARAYGWEESAVEVLGMSRRSIHYDLRLFHLLVEPFPELIESLSRHPIVGENASQLKAVADVREEALRRKVVEALLADEGLNAEDARINVGLLSKSGAISPRGATKHQDHALSNLGRLSSGNQRSIAADIAREIKPTALHAIRDAIIARIAELGVSEDQGGDDGEA